MTRIAIFVLILVFIGLALYLPRFRRTLGGIFLVLVVAIGVIIWLDTQERKLDFERISVNQVELSHMQVREGLNSRSFVIKGRLHNLATSHSIRSAKLQATIKDCDKGQGTACQIVGQESVSLQLSIPSGQGRDFEVTMPFSTIPIVKGKMVWGYKILEVRAQ